MYAYCQNDPVNLSDPSGYEPITIAAILTFAGGALDALSLVMSISDMINNPSWANAGWLALDVLGFALPIVPAVGSVDNILKGALKALAKLDDPANAGKFAKLIAKVMPTGFVTDMILSAQRVGSAASKTDLYHTISKTLTKSQLSAGKVFFLTNQRDGKIRILLQTLGEVNGKKGVHEFILQLDGTVNHQLFIKGGVITGLPNQRVR
jgi:hypothetical protein